jgi:FkbM family methyltransferase
MKFLKIIKTIIYNYFNLNNYTNLTYSQEGEDLILRRFFEDQKTGFFIDIGAHHPKRFSNTYLFYKKGWTGINIDAMPGIMQIFNKIRPKDINIECGISLSKQLLNYHIFNEKALNTFSEEEAKLKSKSDKYFIKEVINIQTYSLSEILDQYNNSFNKIDFMSIDVEGLDLEVLMSNNWDKYRPSIILVEELRTNIHLLYLNSDINKYLNSKGYTLNNRTYNTSFYLDTRI